jgi:DNA adenine methylase
VVVSRSNSDASPRNPKLIHFTPLRYPGGKGKLAPFIKQLIEINDLLDGEYVEPYAGGAAIGLELLLQDYVSKIYINDISRAVFTFWNAVLNQTDDLVKLVRSTPLTVASWDKQKQIFLHKDEHDDLALGFATFFLNRTNRSGILNGGIIGGRDQTGKWKIDARYNAHELAARIEEIARFRRRIVISRQDAQQFLREQASKLPRKTLIYLDPPYYIKGKALYHHYYEHADHEAIAKLVRTKLSRQKWIVSYDNVKSIRELYADCPGFVYGLGYSAREVRHGSEVMFFGNGLIVPPQAGAMRALVGGSRPKLSARPTRAS